MAKKKPVQIVRKHDNSIEVAIRENPAKTRFGRITGYIVIVGFVVLPVTALVIALIQMMSKM